MPKAVTIATHAWIDMPEAIPVVGWLLVRCSACGVVANKLKGEIFASASFTRTNMMDRKSEGNIKACPRRTERNE